MVFNEEAEIPEELILVQLKALSIGNIFKTELYTELAAGSQSVLELGCGTGSRSLEMSETSQVVGAESSTIQIELAKSRDTNEAVEWLNCDPSTLQLDRKFDFVVMGEYFFQSLLTTENRATALATVVAHLKPDGRFMLASRNPQIGIDINMSRKTLPTMLNHTGMGLIEAWNESEYDDITSILTSTDGFNIIGMSQTISETNSIHYSSKDEIMSEIEKAGLHPIKWLGEWSGSDWQANSQNIILIGRLASLEFRI